MLAENQCAVFDSNGLWSHDFIGERIFQHSVLMNPGFVCKRILADDCLVALNMHAGQRREQTARFKNFFRVDVGFNAHCFMPRANCHRNFFKRGVTCPLTNSIDCTFHLACAVKNA